MRQGGTGVLQWETPYPRRKQGQASCIPALKPHQLSKMQGKGLTITIPTFIPTIAKVLGKELLPQYNRQNFYRVNLETIMQTKAFTLVVRIRFCNADEN